MYEKTKKRVFNMDSFFVPGAGELYMGFEKQGVSLMILFWGSVALLQCLVWLAVFYCRYMVLQFFSVHNLNDNEPGKILHGRRQIFTSHG